MKNYLTNTLIALDQLGNALAGGNPDNTISGRTGHFARVATGSQGLFWRTMERVIDWAFYPLDGPNHCQQALANDSQEDLWPSNDWGRALLVLLSLPVCAVVGLLSRIL